MSDNCEDCSRVGSFPLHGGGFSRRRFFQVAGAGIVGSYFLDVVSPSLLQGAVTQAAPVKGTAKNCIFIFLSGAPSNVDLWDLKEGPWTPASFAPTSYGDTRWPQGLMPKTSEHLGKLVLVRSGLAWAAVHTLAQTWTQIARNPTGALGTISPHMGAVVALEAQKTRKITDVLPGFIALNSGGIVGSGYLPSTYAPFSIQPAQTGLAALAHPDGKARLDERWALLQQTDKDRFSNSKGKAAVDMDGYYDQAKVMIDTPEVGQLFTFTAEERVRYGSTTFGDALIVSRNLVRSGRGTRFVQVTMGGWDHHANIYAAAGASVINSAGQFDAAFGTLLTDLAAAPGSESGKTMLDETLIVVMGEFGRTVGALNGQGGRDHALRMSLMFAGGGTRGGRTIGKTNETGSQAVEYGWSGNRDIRPEDVTATIYSALGIDYTTIRTDDPFNRGFEYVPDARYGTYKPVDEVF